MQYALADHLSGFFQQHPATGYLLAFSGGVDSHVLLHVCASLRNSHPFLNFRAIHIDHGLQAVSADWAAHCRAVCQVLNLPFVCESLHLQVPAGESLEAVARDARYASFDKHLQAGEMLLTAHHQNDQAETLLLHLLRGSGVDGLAAMPEVRPFAQGVLGRPLLGCSRAELVAYANQHRLNVIDDPSNLDSRFDRNFLRHQVMPVLEQRWPALGKTLARSARLQGESRQLLANLLREKLPGVYGSMPGTLSVGQLVGQDEAMQKALLREWLVQRGFRLPEEKKLLQVLRDVLQCRPDAMPCVRWEGCEIRRYRDDVYAMQPLSAHDPRQVLVWDTRQPLVIASLGRTLLPQPGYPATVTVRFRQGGESVYLPQRGGHHSLKHLLQEWGVPPWERDRVPLVYAGERLISILGVLPFNP
jgi:tRNA(Ile)-lysidine synthase